MVGKKPSVGRMLLFSPTMYCRYLLLDHITYCHLNIVVRPKNRLFNCICILQVMYAAFDSGNYFVIPGSPAVPFQDRISAKSYDQDVRVSMGLSPSDFVISIVGSQFSYGGFLMEEALVLQAVGSLLQQYPSENSTQLELKVRILAENVTEKHRMALEVII